MSVMAPKNYMIITSWKRLKTPKIKTILLLYWLGSGFEKAVIYLLVPRGRSAVLPFSSFAYIATGQ